MQKCDIRWFFLVLAAVILFSVFGLPYFTQTGHDAWAVLVYVFFAVIFLYGRSNRRNSNARREQLR